MPYVLRQLFPAFADLSGAPVTLSDEEYERFRQEYATWAALGTPGAGVYTTEQGEIITLSFATLPALRFIPAPSEAVGSVTRAAECPAWEPHCGHSGTQTQ